MGICGLGLAAGSLTEVTTKAAEGIEQLTVILQEIAAVAARSGA